MERQTIGVVGYGFVGEAVAKGLCHAADVVVYDKAKGYCGFRDGEQLKGRELVNYINEVSVDSPWRHLVDRCSIIFVCVPTPMLPDGRCDVSVVEEVVEKLRFAAMEAGKQLTAVIKSTVPPGTTERMQRRLDGGTAKVNLVFNPEFLREATHLEDFKEQKNVILGGRDCRDVMGLYLAAFPDMVLHVMSSTEAEMVKYVVNCFLAVKVSFANEVKLVCDAVGVGYDEVIGHAMLDPRLGYSHWRVPGPDGKPGFGGSCLPKDLNAFVGFALDNGVHCHTMDAAWWTNLRIRPERDWEQLKGRVVSDETAD